jgi:hypothetical protein
VSSPLGVYLEVGAKRVFASAADWPGWCRSGKDEEAALANLAAYTPRYARVTKLAHLEIPKDPRFDVIERVKGNATTDFGAPGVPTKHEAKPIATKERERLAAVTEACWKYLDQVVAKAPQELRKGPRGGGRDRDKMYAHVLDAEVGYASAIGLRLKAPDREALSEVFRNPIKDTKWPVTYAMRRIAWHTLDHAWEIEDRLP